ncbi:MAG: ATP-binding protein [Dehalococcoidia bacterium]
MFPEAGSQDEIGAPSRIAPGTRLIVIATPIVILLGAIGLILAWRSYQSERDQVIDESRLLAVSAAADANRFLRGEIALLEAVASSPTMRGPNWAAVEVYLHELVASQPQMLSISWIDLTGSTRAAAPAGMADPAADLSGREYFKAVTQQQASYVSAAQAGEPDDHAAITIAVPTRDTGGELIGLIGARIGLFSLEESLTAFQPRGSGRLLVVDRADQLIVNTEESAGFHDLSASELLRRSRERDTGVQADIDGLQGDPNRIVSFASAPVGGWMVFVERPADAAFSRAEETLITEVVALTFVVLVGVGGLVWTGRWLNRAAAEREQLLTNERTARAEAEYAVHQRDLVLSGVSHDLKSPLTTIRGLAQILRRQAGRLAEAPPGLSDGLDRIDAASVKMVSMIDELLDAARLETGQPLELHQEPMDLVALVRGVADTHQRTTDRHRIVVEEGTTPLVGDWDRPRLERVLDNLLSNSIKYSPEGGTITLTLSGIRDDNDEGGGWAKLTVQDEGLGIPADELSLVFDRFYRGENVAGKIAGTGIGLAGARRIVEQHGGTLIAARAPGRGSIFTMCLPFEP